MVGTAGDARHALKRRRSLRKNAAFYGGSIPWVKSGELRDGLVEGVAETITQAGLDNSSAKLFPKGTLCIALYGATVGKLGILGMDAATTQAVCGIFLPPFMEPRYFFNTLMRKRGELIAQGKGGAQPTKHQPGDRSSHTGSNTTLERETPHRHQTRSPPAADHPRPRRPRRRAVAAREIPPIRPLPRRPHRQTRRTHPQQTPPSPQTKTAAAAGNRSPGRPRLPHRT